MDNREFDKIFSEGLNEKRSFDGAEENWQKLRPRLHPPKKKRRIIFWPFMAAAVAVLGVSTIWYYQQSNTLKNEIAEMSAKLEESQNADVKMATSSEEVTTDQVIAADGETAIVKSDVEGSSIIKAEEPSTSGTSVSNTKTYQETADNGTSAVRNTIPVEVRTADMTENIAAAEQEQITSSPTKNEQIAINKYTAFDQLLAKSDLLSFLRDLPDFKIWTPLPMAEDLEKKDERKHHFSAGLNSGIAGGGGNGQSDFERANAVSFDDESSFSLFQQPYYHSGLHGNYDLNKNWQLQASVNLEWSKIDYGFFYPISGVLYESTNIDPGFSVPGFGQITNLESFQATTVNHRQWLVDVGINRRLFSIKKFRCFAGVHSSSRLFVRQNVAHTGNGAADPNGTSKAEISGSNKIKPVFSVSPGIGIGSPIGKRIYWNLDTRYAFHINNNSTFLAPRWSLRAGVGYRF